MIQEPLFYLSAFFAVMIAGISKGGFGGGVGVMAVPLMALVIPPFQAAAIMLPILCIMDLAGLKAFWKKWDNRNILIMIPGSVLGILIAFLTYRWVSDDHLRILIGVIAVVFALNYYLNRAPEGSTPALPSWTRGTFWSTVAGFTSFSAHAGGPPMNMYLLPQRLDKTLFVGTTVMFFTVVNYVKLVPYALLGQFDTTNLMTALVLGPLAIFGVYSGYWLHKRISIFVFYRICYAFLLITGGRLLYQGVTNLWF
ncbi:MAG: sulfite exporter TauE/SafE family protein [Natronospirillum sp.]|uniref:sulfite exporter TauE/SafE family protein n=1 Tax=Natronospirillum sp. TaxID=2812955 RepID=UPI0025F8A27A|nr:sulfite exporter TauE/SafE family protein [Natronospirillum sp.]MCH8550929.1 sulfite exporter TauE/SafE family protein [Natronospirillum sp.]